MVMNTLLTIENQDQILPQKICDMNLPNTSNVIREEVHLYLHLPDIQLTQVICGEMVCIVQIIVFSLDRSCSPLALLVLHFSPVKYKLNLHRLAVTALLSAGVMAWWQLLLRYL